MVKRFAAKIKRAYHRWCLKNAIAYAGLEIRVYNASTNSYIVHSGFTGNKYHAYVDSNGEIRFVGVEYE